MKTLNLATLQKKVQSMLTQQNLVVLLVVSLVALPILDLDYLIYPYLNALGLPRFSTVFNFIGLPLVIFISFLINERQKKKALLMGGLIVSVVALYFLIHHWVVKDMFLQLYLTNRYIYSFGTELAYVLRLFIPLLLVYAFFRGEFNQALINKVAITLSIMLAVPLFFSNLFLFGPSTYYDGPTLANFPTWFMGIYETHNPKHLATQFYFSEGNTTGIVLFSIFPLVLRQLFQPKPARGLYVLIFIQGWAMYVLATRVATYGVLLMLGATLAVWLLLVGLKRERFQWKPLIFLSLLLAMFLAALPFTPAVQNLSIDRENNALVFADESLRLQFKDELGGQDLIPGTAQFNYYFQNMFEKFYWLLTISEEYYLWYYPYQIDPKFYIDLIFEVDFFDRASGRQFQQIFFDYKWDKLSFDQKFWGFGYSRFMNGSILLEQDFLMQKYTLGYVGVSLLTLPWLALVGYIAYKGLRHFKKIWDFDFIVLSMAIVAILGGAYLSGHVLDQFFSSVVIAFYVGTMLFKVAELDKLAK